MDNAQHIFDEQGVPSLRIKGVGDVRNPAWVALYSLEYFGAEHYGAGINVAADDTRGLACAQWLAKNLKPNGVAGLAWTYDFNNTYNDITIKAPWISAFGQAVGVQALLESTRHGGPKEYIALALKAAQPLMTPLTQGGLMFKAGSDMWFEEVGSPAANPPHILNGHMRALLALRALAEATGDPACKTAFQSGLATLLRWLPLYDNGYWLRYDLNPRKSELLFRFNNPYGFKLPNLAIDKITLTDPLSGQASILNVGANPDAEGSLRIAGNDWSQAGVLDGRNIRRLQAVMPADTQLDLDGELHAPGTYFYLTLPSAWANNLRSEPLELAIEYKDEAPGNACIQQRAIAPGPAFRDLPDGDLLLSGSGQWRTWRIPIRTNSLGYWVGLNYARKHAEYLESLARDDPRLASWALTARGYANLAKTLDDPKIVTRKPVELPSQTPMLPMWSVDAQGVLMEHMAGPRTHLRPDGTFDNASEGGPSLYQPYIIAEQARKGAAVMSSAAVPDITFLKAFPDFYQQYHWVTRENLGELRRAPALSWLAKNGQVAGANHEALIWNADFDNAYNDVAMKKPWPSAFFQAYIALAFSDALQGQIHDPPLDYATLTRQAALGLFVPVNQQGVMTSDRSGLPFFEEVPGATHVLNAHLVSTTALGDILPRLPNPTLAAGETRAIQSLREHLNAFDTGYWLRYDMNPKKDLVFQINWLEGVASPLIESITLENPQTNTATQIAVGDSGSFSAYPGISGVDWRDQEIVDGRAVRGFDDGYDKRKEPLAGAARHNVFFHGALPERQFADLFDVPVHRLVLRYKDTRQGLFELKIQAINDGNALAFIPLRGGILHCTGDNQWKEATFVVRPQDMGWFVGPDYQTFDVDQLQLLAKQTGDWYFQQRAAQQKYYFDAFHVHQPTILEPAPLHLRDISSTAKVVSSTATYAGFGVENALDGDPNNNYVAAVEGPLPQEFVLDLLHPAEVREITMEWESEENFATSFEIDALAPDGTVTPLANVENGHGQIQIIALPEGRNVQKLRFTIRATHGQQRLLLRLLKIMAVQADNP